MAMSEYYVDPSIAGNSGTGTIGDPYGDLQYALNSITRNLTDGDRINIKAGTEEVFTAAIDYTTYTSPTAAAPLIYQGYSSAAGDGGIAEIDLGGNNLSQNVVHLADLKIRNAGSGTNGFLLAFANATNVWFSDSSAAHGVTLSPGTLDRCVFSDLTGTVAVSANSQSHITGCYFELSASESPTAYAIRTLQPQVISHNCFKLETGITAIAITDDVQNVSYNSILQTGAKAGTGFSTGDTKYGHRFNGNIIEGFATGFDWGNQNEPPGHAYENAAYNNTTNYDSTFLGPYYNDNETLSSSAFAKSGTITLSDFVSDNAGFWASVAAYFEPQNTGNVFGNFGSLYLTKGAVPRPARTVSPSRHPLARF